MDQSNIVTVLLTVGIAKGEIALVVDYCLNPHLQAMG